LQNFTELKSRMCSFFLPCEENGYRARIFSGNFLIFFLIAIAAVKLEFAFFLYSFPNNPFYADITRTALVEMANAERAKQNLPELAENALLNQAAYMKALDMATSGYFNHISPAGINPWHWFSQAGYDYKYAGENLAIGFIDSKEVQDAWVASPTHKANIVNGKYKEIGIAVLKASFQGNPATIVVQMFGAKSSSPQTGKTALSTSITKGASFGQDQNQASSNVTLDTKNVLGISTAANPQQNSIPFKMAWFFSQKFFSVIQFFIYASLAFITLLLAVNFALKADFNHADLLLKAAGFAAVMLIFGLLDHSLIAALLPRTI